MDSLVKRSDKAIWRNKKKRKGYRVSYGYYKEYLSGGRIFILRSVTGNIKKIYRSYQDAVKDGWVAE